MEKPLCDIKRTRLRWLHPKWSLENYVSLPQAQTEMKILRATKTLIFNHNINSSTHSSLHWQNLWTHLGKPAASLGKVPPAARNAHHDDGGAQRLHQCVHSCMHWPLTANMDCTTMVKAPYGSITGCCCCIIISTCAITTLIKGNSKLRNRDLIGSQLFMK